MHDADDVGSGQAARNPSACDLREAEIGAVTTEVPSNAVERYGRNLACGTESLR